VLLHGITTATSIASPTLTKTGTDLSQSNFSLNNAQFTGRTPVKYWNGSVSNSWTVANNWTPSGVPTSSDNIDFNGNADNPCVLSSNATVNHLTFSDGGNFTAASGASLTVAGNFTYNPWRQFLLIAIVHFLLRTQHSISLFLRFNMVL
jgi:hypothetical protein